MTKEDVQRRMFRNIAFCVHWAMWKRGISEDELIERTGLSAELIRSVLVGSGCELGFDQLSDIMFHLEMWLEFRIEPVEPPPLSMRREVKALASGGG